VYDGNALGTGTFSSLSFRIITILVVSILVVSATGISDRFVLAQDAQKNSQLLFLARMRFLQLILKQGGLLNFNQSRWKTVPL
jgi:uncharacterized membrane protein affecting hemolysin expression